MTRRNPEQVGAHPALRMMSGTYCRHAGLCSQANCPKYRESMDNTWGILRGGVAELLTTKPHPHLSFESLYTSAYHVTLCGQGPELYQMVTDSFIDHIKTTIRRRIVEGLRNGHTLAVVEEWTDFTERVRSIGDVLMYMDRTFVITTGRKRVSELGEVLFGEHIFDCEEIRDVIQRTFLEFVEQWRKGVEWDTYWVRGIKHIIGTAIIDSDRRKEMIKLLFDNPFVDESKEHYPALSESFWKEGSVSCYASQAVNFVQRERQLIEQVLETDIQKELRQRILDEFVLKYETEFFGMEKRGVAYLVQNRELGGMGHIYQLVSDLPHLKRRVAYSFSEMLRQLQAEQLTPIQDSCDPQRLVEHVLQFKKVHDDFSHSGLAENDDLSKLFRHVMKGFLSSSGDLPRMLASSIRTAVEKCEGDSLSEECWNLINSATFLYAYLPEQRKFQYYVQADLATRLCRFADFGLKKEDELTNGLAECDPYIARNLRMMLKEYRDRRWMDDAFFERSRRMPQMENTNIIIATKEFWPKPSFETRVILPEAQKQQLDVFAESYSLGTLATPQRPKNLYIHPDLGSAEIEATFGVRKVTLEVNPTQMCILMLFNDVSGMLVTEIHERTAIPMRYLECLLAKFIRRGLFMKSGDVILINDNFIGEGYVSLLPSREEMEELRTVEYRRNSSNNSDRNAALEAAVIRVMKRERNLRSVEVMERVVGSWKSAAMPSCVCFKRTFARLLAKGYIVVDADDKERYHYVP